MGRRTGCGLAVLLCLLLGCTGCETPQKEEPKNRNQSSYTLMYLPYGPEEESLIFADSEEFYYVGIPEGALYDENGEAIAEEELVRGDLLEVTGSLSPQEVWPPGFESVERMQRTGHGSEEEIEKQMKRVYETFWDGEGYGTKPELYVSYQKDGKRYDGQLFFTDRYTWAYEDYKGDWIEEKEEGEPIGELRDYSQFIVPMEVDPPGFRFYFEEKPLAVTVKKYPKGEDEVPTESVMEVKDCGVYFPSMESGACYVIEARWDLGAAGKGYTGYYVNVQDETPYKKAYERFRNSEAGQVQPSEDGRGMRSPSYNVQEWLDPADFE